MAPDPREHGSPGRLERRLARRRDATRRIALAVAALLVAALLGPFVVSYVAR